MTNEVIEIGSAPVLDEIIQGVRKLIKYKGNNGYK
jgi:hypothetical protein